jgi:hypothetical protein
LTLIHSLCKLNITNRRRSSNEKTPLGINSIVKNQVEEIQDKKGVIYCLKMLSEQNNNKDSYSLEPYYLVYVDENNEVQLPYSNAKNILDIYKKLTLGNDDIQSELFKSFENETKDYSNMNHYVEGLQNSIESIIGKKDEKGLDSLFSGGGTGNNRIHAIHDSESLPSSEPPCVRTRLQVDPTGRIPKHRFDQRMGRREIQASRLRQGLLFHQAEERPVPDGGGEEGNQGTHPERVRRGRGRHRLRRSGIYRRVRPSHRDD